MIGSTGVRRTQLLMRQAGDWLIGSDPGLLRLQVAARTTVTTGVTLLVLYVLSNLTGQRLPPFNTIDRSRRRPRARAGSDCESERRAGPLAAFSPTNSRRGLRLRGSPSGSRHDVHRSLRRRRRRAPRQPRCSITEGDWTVYQARADETAFEREGWDFRCVNLPHAEWSVRVETANSLKPGSGRRAEFSQRSQACRVRS